MLPQLIRKETLTLGRLLRFSSLPSWQLLSLSSKLISNRRIKLQDFRDFRVFVFGIGANSQTRKILQSFSCERNSLNFSSLHFKQMFSCFSQLIQNRRIELGRFPRFSSFLFGIWVNSKTCKILRNFSHDRKSLCFSGLPSLQLFTCFSQLIQNRRIKSRRFPTFPSFRIWHMGKFENSEKFFSVSGLI